MTEYDKGYYDAINEAVKIIGRESRFNENRMTLAAIGRIGGKILHLKPKKESPTE